MTNALAIEGVQDLPLGDVVKAWRSSWDGRRLAKRSRAKESAERDRQTRDDAIQALIVAGIATSDLDKVLRIRRINEFTNFTLPLILSIPGVSYVGVVTFGPNSDTLRLTMLALFFATLFAVILTRAIRDRMTNSHIVFLLLGSLGWATQIRSRRDRPCIRNVTWGLMQAAKLSEERLPGTILQSKSRPIHLEKKAAAIGAHLRELADRALDPDINKASSIEFQIAKILPNFLSTEGWIDLPIKELDAAPIPKHGLLRAIQGTIGALLLFASPIVSVVPSWAPWNKAASPILLLLGGLILAGRGSIYSTLVKRSEK
jgi:hypothetical protein